MIVRKRGDWLAATVADEVLMMNTDNGLYLGLNPVGARIWQMIDTPCDVETLCARLEHEFDVAPATCRAEVDAFLDQLARHRAIDFEPQPGS